MMAVSVAVRQIPLGRGVSPNTTIQKTIDVLGELTLQKLLIEAAKRNLLYAETPSVFDVDVNPQGMISLERYIKRINKYSGTEPGDIITACIYIVRLYTSGAIRITARNMHKICAISIMTAEKYNHDSTWSNKSYAGIFGVKLQELNVIENTFLDLLDWELYVSVEEFRQMLLCLDTSYGCDDISTSEVINSGGTAVYDLSTSTEKVLTSLLLSLWNEVCESL